MRTATPQEIVQLHSFVRQHYVEFYDVELELVDHLAHDIEEQWRKDKALSFEKALDCAFKKFGVFGFTDVVASKIDRLKGRYIKLMLREVGSFFTLPKIIFSLAIYLILFAIGYTYQEVGIWSLYCILFGIISLYIVVGMLWQRKIKQRQKSVNKRFLLESVAVQSYAGGAFISFTSMMIQLPHLTSFIANTILATCIVALLILFMGLWTYVAIYVLMPQLQREIQQLPQKYQAV
ncbi:MULTISPECIES: hypothetical protein [unclassified Myroides]|uniref:hypothetical protein n=1 Tax=unclassified Myroides TaxID=2642485 RepID=UPI003D2F5404